MEAVDFAFATAIGIRVVASVGILGVLSLDAPRKVETGGNVIPYPFQFRSGFEFICLGFLHFRFASSIGIGVSIGVFSISMAVAVIVDLQCMEQDLEQMPRMIRRTDLMLRNGFPRILQRRRSCGCGFRLGGVEG